MKRFQEKALIAPFFLIGECERRPSLGGDSQNILLFLAESVF